MILDFWGQSAEKKNGKIKSPATSESLPVKSFEKAYLMKKSFSSKVTNPAKKRCDLIFIICVLLSKTPFFKLILAFRNGRILITKSHWIASLIISAISEIPIQNQ